MKKFFKTIAVLCMAVAASSCGTMLQNSSNSGTNLTNVELSHANYRIVKNVEGFASASYICGIGGLSQKATRDNAIADMMRKANLTDSQAIVNVHIKNHFASVLFFYMRHSCTATAQVIEFLPEADSHGAENHPRHTQKSADYSINSPHPNKTSKYEKRYTVGDLYDNGDINGYVFEVSADGKHGKIVTSTLLDRVQWCVKGAQDNMPDATNDEDGEINMQIIKAIPDWQNKFPAFAVCAQLGSQWYLPAKNELISIRQMANIKKVLKFTDVWSSTVNKKRKAETSFWKNVDVTDKVAVIAVAKF